jgi:hypothetical protein
LVGGSGEVIGPAADGFIDVGGDVREIMMHAAARSKECLGQI